ncbi:carbohydrate ABC transporter permease [Paenibacillus chitinolyticus]
MNARLREKMRRNGLGWGFVLPSLLFLCIFTYYPMLKSVWLSFFEKNLVVRDPVFVGLGNYKALLHDPVFVQVFGNNIWFALGTVPVSMALAFLLALFADKAIRGKGLIRIAFFYPNMIPMIAAASIWLFLYMPQFGLFARLSSWIAGSELNLLGNPNTVLPALIVMTVWKEAGYFMIFYLAGRQQISKELYESADVDGIGAWMRELRITIPLTMPTTLFVAVVAITNAFKWVDHLWMMTKGGPDHASSLLLYYIYETTFNFYDEGMASAMTVVMIVLLLLISWIQFAGWDRKIHYQ